MAAVAWGALRLRGRVPLTQHVLGSSSANQRISERVLNAHFGGVFAIRSLSTSVRQEKLAAKQKRTQAYESSQQRMQKLQSRREGRDTGLLKREFRDWYDKKRIYQEIIDRKARQANMEWTVQAAAILERLPVITPDMPQWEIDYFDLKTYLEQFGKEYPEELGFSPGKGKLAITNEELLGTLHVTVRMNLNSMSML